MEDTAKKTPADKDLPQAATAQPGEELGRTMITDKKVFLDELGKLRLEQEKKAAQAAQAAPPAGADAAQGAPAAPAGGGNKRLSAETLFAFALPEQVVEAGAKLKPATPAAESSSKSKLPKAPDGKSIKMPLLAGVVVLLLLGAVWALFSGGEQEQSNVPDVSVQTVQTGPVGEVQPDAAAEGSTTAAAGETASDKAPVAVDIELTPEQKTALAAFNSTDPKALEKAVQEGAKLKSPVVTKKILELASHPNAFVRIAVAKTLIDKNMYTPDMQPAVVGKLLALLDDTDYLVRGYSARALGNTGDKSALPKLLARLDSENEEEVVKKLVKAAADQLERQ